ncbi:HD domain-containing protein [Sporolactobacillus sp. CPB3-1]|uniref:HD domain-containing protein n=1 Tax=Sporolactobacillus mangiferae TaxID=2940498 RepID=A0ABT0MCR1_9BACL|nr:HD domain-containing phosphohydrolase [Sporolactobacillus mangiferae]MCL1632672.1 HD domain-containing protein [Sporolactobacillus mangiferae]
MPKVVNLECLKDGCVLAKDIYFNSSVLYRTGMLITSELIDYLKRIGVRSVTIFDAPPIAPFRKQFTPQSQLTENERKELTSRFQNEMTQIANELRYGRILHSESSYHWLHAIYVKFFSNPTVRFLMDALKQWDPVCYIHSLDVFVLTSLYFKHVGWTVSQDFMLGCLLHDIGKLYTPIEILLKQGKLTQREYHKIKQHTTDGYQLMYHMHFPEETCRVVRSHHERLDGSGYPDHLHIEADDRALKLMMIVDVYSALTLNRSYRKPMHATKAMQIILADSAERHLFDLNICYLFINFIHIFPPATRVLLTSGKPGVILANPSGSDILPRIKLERSGEIVQLPSDLSLTIESITSWDSSEVVLQARQTWKDYIRFLINGDSVKAVDCLDTLSDGMRIEDVFVRLFEHAWNEIQKGTVLQHFMVSESMSAAMTLLRLLSWKMLKNLHQLPGNNMGHVIVANLNAFQGLVPTKLIDDLFTLNGWKTEFLPEIDEVSAIYARLRRSKANYLVVSLIDGSHCALLNTLLSQIASEFPNLTVFVHVPGRHVDLSDQSMPEHLLISTCLSDVITHIRHFFIKGSVKK